MVVKSGRFVFLLLLWLEVDSFFWINDNLFLRWKILYERIVIDRIVNIRWKICNIGVEDFVGGCFVDVIFLLVVV